MLTVIYSLAIVAKWNAVVRGDGERDRVYDSESGALGHTLSADPKLELAPNAETRFFCHLQIAGLLYSWDTFWEFAFVLRFGIRINIIHTINMSSQRIVLCGIVVCLWATTLVSAANEEHQQYVATTTPASAVPTKSPSR